MLRSQRKKESISSIVYLTLDTFQEDLVIKIENGMIKGRKEQTFDKNVTYLAFQGIPYAKPPLGELRFKVSIVGTRITGINIRACSHLSFYNTIFSLASSTSRKLVRNQTNCRRWRRLCTRNSST